MRCALKFNILDAPFCTYPALFIRTAFCIYNKHIGFYLIKCREIVDDSASLIDIRILHCLDILDHEESFFLREHRLAVLILQISSI